MSSISRNAQRKGILNQTVKNVERLSILVEALSNVVNEMESRLKNAETSIEFLQAKVFPEKDRPLEVAKNE